MTDVSGGEDADQQTRRLFQQEARQTRAQGSAAMLAQALTMVAGSVARLIAAGATTKQAASQMFLSPRTIDAHLRSIYAKLGITSRNELRSAKLTGTGPSGRDP